MKTIILTILFCSLTIGNLANAQAIFSLAGNILPLQTNTASVISYNGLKYSDSDTYRQWANGGGIEIGLSMDYQYFDEYKKFYTFGFGIFANKTANRGIYEGTTSALGIFVEYKIGLEFEPYTVYLQARTFGQSMSTDVNLYEQAIAEHDYDPELTPIQDRKYSGFFKGPYLFGAMIGLGISKGSYFITLGLKLTEQHHSTTGWRRASTPGGIRFGIRTESQSKWQIEDKFSPVISFGKIWFIGS